jgi:membrane protein implicated in regulation of membrane protease activity
MALVWVVVAVGLLLFELHHLAFYSIFAAAGAAVAALVAALAPHAYAAQGITALAVAAIGIWLVRPWVSEVYERRHPHVHVARGVHGGLIGHEAVALDQVGDVMVGGHVRFVGERWLARSSEGDAIAPGSTVLIVAVEGTTLVVVPVEDGRS